MVNRLIWPIAAALLFDIVSVAYAHKPGADWAYPLACCKGTEVGGDCHRIPDSDVKEGSRGYVIDLLPGDHPLVTTRHTFLIPYGDEIPSGDGDFHACLHPTEDNLNCFFAPPKGF